MRARCIAPLFIAGVVTAGCGELRPRLGYPWVESNTLALEHERLELRVVGDELHVRAAMRFRAHTARAGLEMLFPEDERDAPLRDLVVRWGAERCETSARQRRAFDGGPPLSHVRRWHRFVVGPLRRGEATLLLVTYRQRLPRGRAHVRYLLRTGAYWRGAIGTLLISVDDRAGRVARAQFGDAPPQRAAHRLWWSQRDVEPSADVVVELTKAKETR